jgi:hypothetical protein
MSAPDPQHTAQLAAALFYAAHGLRVAPIKPGRKYPPMREWQRAATTDPAVITAWWTGLYRDHGVGIVTGAASGVWVLDVDVAGAKIGAVSLARLEAAHGPLPVTVEGVTGTDGRHLFFTWDPAHPVHNDQSGRLGPDLDVRGEGGQVLAAPTLHPATGAPYRFRAGRAFGETPVAAAPAFLYELLEAPASIQHLETRSSPPAALARGLFPPADGEDSPAAHFNATTTWPQLLERDGWTLAGHLGSGEQRWTRPGKTPAEGISATVGHGGRDVFKVFTSSVPELRADEAYSRFGYEAAVRYHGDRPALARAIRTTMTGSPARRGDDLAFARQPPGEAQLVSETPAPTGDEEDLAADDGHGWETTDLAPFLAGGYEQPQPTVLACAGGGHLWYPGRVNGLFGESSSGKSWIAMKAAVEEMAARHSVVYVDLEDHASSVVARLHALGATDEDLLERFHYIAPSLPWRHEASVAVAALIEARAVTLVVIDSTGEAMALDGAKPNDDDATSLWFRRLPRYVAKFGPAVVLIDHVPKARDGEGRRTEIGSQRKRAAIEGATYEVEVRVAPARGRDGHLRLVCQKDRNGTYARGQTVADVAITSTGSGPGSVVVSVSRHEPTNRPTTLMVRVSAYLEQLDRWASMNAIERAVSGKTAGKRLAVTTLVSEGFVAMEVRAGQGAGSYFRHVRPFADHAESSNPVDSRESDRGPRPTSPPPRPHLAPPERDDLAPSPPPPEGGRGGRRPTGATSAQPPDHHQPPFPAAEEPADQPYRLLP